MVLSFEIASLYAIYYNKNKIENYNWFSLIYVFYLLITIYEYTFNNDIDRKKRSVVVLALYLRYFIEISISLSHSAIVILSILYIFINIPVIIQFDIIIEASSLFVICLTISIVFLNKTRKLITFIS